MRTFLFIFFFMTFISSINAQTELQKLETIQKEETSKAKKQASFNAAMVGKLQTSSTFITYIPPGISPDYEMLIEEKIKNYKASNYLVLTDKDEGTTANNSNRVPLSEFSSFPLAVQKYIVDNRSYYETHIKFD